MSKKHKPHKEDNSPIIAQREKIKEELNIKEFKWTEKQKQFIELAQDKNTKIIICKSPPGTGKTLLSLFCSLIKLRDKKIGNVVYIRNPVESASSGMGYLPGELDAKMDWVIQPLRDHLNELLSPSQINTLVNDSRIQGIPLGYIKGRTFHSTAMIVDEAEDLNTQELCLAMCRLGQYSQLFIIGDIKQSNIKKSGFDNVFNLFNNDIAKSHGIHTFEFNRDDIMRNSLIKYIVGKFDGEDDSTMFPLMQ